jgi:hypothetical protein
VNRGGAPAHRKSHIGGVPQLSGIGAGGARSAPGNSGRRGIHRCYRQYFAAAPVHNVVAVLPGTDPTGCILLVVHHGNQPLTPGAGDNGAAAAALLETARALAEGPRPRIDVVLVLNDAEENLLFGAEAFVNEHPLAADGG